MANETYRGKPLEELTREELLEAARWAWKEVEHERRMRREIEEMSDLFKKTDAAFAAYKQRW